MSPEIFSQSQFVQLIFVDILCNLQVLAHNLPGIGQSQYETGA